MSESHCTCQEEAQEIRHKSVLITLLVINGLMFIMELAAGLLADSTGLLADSLDMLADACVYGVSLYAVGQGKTAKIRAAFWSGVFQIGLAGVIFLDIARRLFQGSEPESLLMFLVGWVALVANIYCLKLVAREKGQGVHMRASWIFSRNDVIANIGVLAAAVLVWMTGQAWPDILIGLIITGVVMRGGGLILKDARKETQSAA